MPAKPLASPPTTESSTTNSPAAASPAAATSARLPALDVLRGIAILGTLLTNIWIFSGAGGTEATFDDPTRTSPDGAIGDFADTSGSLLASMSNLISQGLGLVTDGKFIGLLTIMFGIGLEIQRQSALRRGEKWPGRYPWRAGLLVLDGLLNYIFIFEFDVLMGYGLTGLVVAIIMATSPKTQKIWMFIGIGVHLLFIVGGTIFYSFIEGDFGSGLPSNPADTAENSTDMGVPAGDGTYWGGVVLRLTHFWVGRSEIPVMFTMGLGLFLVGAHLYRAGLFLPEGRRLRLWVMGLSFGIGLPVDWVLRLTLADTAGSITRYVTSSLVSFGVLALVAHFYVRRTGTGSAGTALALVGRMALTCYILQNLVASIIFYQWGFGVADLIAGGGAVLWTLLIYLVIASALVGFSALWLSKFSRGPVELVWHRSYEVIGRALDRRSGTRSSGQE